MKTSNSNTVTSAINELLEAGWIADKEKGNSYNHKANTYYLPDKKRITYNNNDGNSTIENDGSPTINSTVTLPLIEGSNNTNNNNTNNNNLNNNKTNHFSSSLHSEENHFLGYPFNCAWLLKAMVEANVFNCDPPTFISDKKSARKWAAQLNELVLLGAKEEIKQIIPECLYDGFKIDEPAAITERLEAHLANSRNKRERKWEER
jgi:hypothetical protein